MRQLPTVARFRIAVLFAPAWPKAGPVAKPKVEPLARWK
jgi:hypothetical protein